MKEMLIYVRFTSGKFSRMIEVRNWTTKAVLDVVPRGTADIETKFLGELIVEDLVFEVNPCVLRLHRPDGESNQSHDRSLSLQLA